MSPCESFVALLLKKWLLYEGDNEVVQPSPL